MKDKFHRKIAERIDEPERDILSPIPSVASNASDQCRARHRLIRIAIHSGYHQCHRL